VKEVTDIPEVVREAFALAGGNRPGPVLIDIPKDIQQQYSRDAEGNYTPPRIPAVIEAPEPEIGGLTDDQLGECCRMLADPGEPYLLDVIVEGEENVFPMIPAGGSYRDIIMSAEDLAARARGSGGSSI